jgi:hypothetical protein
MPDGHNAQDFIPILKAQAFFVDEIERLAGVRTVHAGLDDEIVTAAENGERIELKRAQIFKARADSGVLLGISATVQSDGVEMKDSRVFSAPMKMHKLSIDCNS